MKQILEHVNVKVFPVSILSLSHEEINSMIQKRVLKIMVSRNLRNLILIQFKSS